jgi:purine-binding chemotaxis protein CheW
VSSAHQLLEFQLEKQFYALHLASVDQVSRAAEYTLLPKAPPIVLGVINVRGEIIPVINIRKRFNVPERELALTDHFIICHTSKRRVALVADSATRVVDYSPETIVAAEKILPAMEYIQGVAKLPDGLILIHDLEKFLSLDEERAIQEALSQIKTVNA